MQSLSLCFLEKITGQGCFIYDEDDKRVLQIGQILEWSSKNSAEFDGGDKWMCANTVKEKPLSMLVEYSLVAMSV